MQAITLEVILRTVFGLEGEAELARMRRAIVAWSALGASRLGTGLLVAMPPVHAPKLRAIAEAQIRIGRRSVPLGRLAPWSPLIRAKAELDELLHAAIRARRAPSARGADGDVLSMLLAARDESGQPMSDQELHDEMLTLVLAGHETSATALAWTVYHLLANPDAMARVRTELDQVVGRRGAAAAPGLDDLSRLEWIDAAIKETLRLTPIVPFVARKLAAPARIGGRDLPAGVVALACIYLAHRRPELWTEPARFDPGRFLGRRIDPYHYFPFGGGTRRCLGMAFAGYEMKIALATILSRVSLEPVPGTHVRVVRRGVTFAPSGGMPVVARGLS
jgi:cytochrome P450